MSRQADPTSPAVDGPTPAPPAPPVPPRHRRRIIRWAGVAVAVLAITFGAILGTRLGQDPSLVSSPLVGQPAPAETLPYLERPGRLSLPSLRGRVVVVNFWASWCIPCRDEQPILAAAATAYNTSGVTFVGIDYQDQRGAAVAFLDELGRGSGYQYVTDPGSKAAVDFGLFGVPETFFLDRSGTVVAKITGATSAQLLGDTIDAMLAGRTPRSRNQGPVQPAPTVRTP